jgi:phage-related protein
VDLSSTVTIVAPSTTDGRGETAQLNGLTTDTHFVGYLFDASGFDGPSVRLSQDDIVEGHGAVFGSFYHGAREFTIEADLKASTSYAASMTRMRKLYRAFNAMAGDGTVTWVEGGGASYFVSFRRSQPPRGPDKERKVLLSGICADPRIYKSGSPTSHATAATNNGTVESPPTVTFTPSGNGTVILRSTTLSQSVTLTVGTGYLAASGAVTVDFGARTVTQAGTRKDQAVSFPSSTWWEVIPGANAWTGTTGTATFSVAPSFSFRDAWL